MGTAAGAAQGTLTGQTIMALGVTLGPRHPGTFTLTPLQGTGVSLPHCLLTTPCITTTGGGWTCQLILGGRPPTTEGGPLLPWPPCLQGRLTEVMGEGPMVVEGPVDRPLLSVTRT